MNVLLLTISTFFAPLPMPSMADTIILNAGRDSKIVFYGKSSEDLKKLEALDLNKILKDLNARQTQSDSLVPEKIVLDNRGFLNEGAKPGRVQSYLENTFVNLHIGTGYRVNRYTFFQPPPSRLNLSTARLTSDVVMENLLTSSFSVMHDMKFVKGKRYVFAMRYGVGLGLNIQRFVHWNLVQSITPEERDVVVPRALNLLKLEDVTPSQSDFNAFQSFVQLSPKISFKDKKGFSTFYFDLGLRLNYNRNFQNVNPAAYANTLTVGSSFGPTVISGSQVVTGGGYVVSSEKRTVGLSYLAEVGYKWIGLFAVYYPNNIHLSTLPGPDRPGSGFIPGKKGSLGYVSFGLRLGR